MGKGYWDDSPRFFGDSFGALMSKTMFTAVHPDEDRFLNIREMMHLMGLPHDFEIDKVNNFNHIAQVRYFIHSQATKISNHFEIQRTLTDFNK